jgi:hypothetical protein
LSGYGVLQDCAPVDPTKDDGSRIYGPLRLTTFCADFFIKNKFEPGLFIGFTKNLGSSDPLWDFRNTSPVDQPCTPAQIASGDTAECLPTQDRRDAVIFAYVDTIDYTMTIAPRIKWVAPPITFGLELEYTKIGYGNTTKWGAVDCANPVENLRIIFEGYFNF